MKPEEEARKKIDNQLNDAGWGVIGRDEYIPAHSLAVRESVMDGRKKSDYLFFIDDKAIAVLEAKREENKLGKAVAQQAEHYAAHPQKWYGSWFENQIPLVYLANGKTIYFRNVLDPNSEYVEIKKMHSPKEMLRLIGRNSAYGKLPLIKKEGLRDCQYDALVKLEEDLRLGRKRFLAILATGSGKTYLACLAAYRHLAYLNAKRVLFLVDRNNLGKQAVTEFSVFNRTESGESLSKIYDVRRLQKKEDIKGTIIISTIQKLYAYMTGMDLPSGNEDEEDEYLFLDNGENDTPIVLGDDIKLPRDYFDFIVVDECHRSIYGKWQNVLKYFNNASILGLTATPIPDAYAFFDANIIENYTYEKSVVDGVNVPYDVYVTKTRITETGGHIEAEESFFEKSKRTGKEQVREAEVPYDYTPAVLDRGITAPEQIDTVIKQFRDSIYTDLYPDRAEKWEYIPKTLIFAKNDNHASEILASCRRVFAEKFSSGVVPESFVQKITYTSGDSNQLIQQFRTSKDFRIAITVTLVSTGTDIKPLEIVLFMKDVQSEVLYQQMKGRGCRTITDSALQDVTPNADTKSKFIVFDAVGVTTSEKKIPQGSIREPGTRKPSIEEVLEYLSHGYVTDENLFILGNYCSSINQRYENNRLQKHHLDDFFSLFGFTPRSISSAIVKAFEDGSIPDFIQGGDNTERKMLIQKLMINLDARKKLLEMYSGYDIKVDTEDEVLFSGFDIEGVRDHITKFETYISEHKDEIEALRLIYNSEVGITMSMLQELKDRILEEDRTFTNLRLWSWYRMLDEDSQVGDPGSEVECLTNLIQLVRYAYRISSSLVSLSKYANSRFNLYAGQEQYPLSSEQVELMKRISEYVIENGVLETQEFLNFDIDIWRKLIILFGDAANADTEIRRMSGFILKAV